MSNTQPKLDTLTKRLSVDTPNSTVSLPDLPPPRTPVSAAPLSPPPPALRAPPVDSRAPSCPCSVSRKPRLAAPSLVIFTISNS
jgi:hypothetical protein